ncbi:MAG: insulinase family protein [Limnochordaceae bacterium]|nr:insulinase family protein [Limnochordaceae bacterium]
MPAGSEYEKTALDNGIQVISETIPYLRSVTVGFFYRVGSQDEAPAENGYSHALEHLMFKGTPTRSAQEIAELFDNIGGQLNAFTTKEFTCYYARFLDEHFPLAMDALTDMLCHATFPPDEVEREKNVILEEIKMYKDDPEEVAHDLFLRHLLGRDSLGQTVLGPARNMQRLTREKVIAFRDRHYTPDRLLVAAIGQVSHARLVDEVARAFGDLPRGDQTNSDARRPTIRPDCTPSSSSGLVSSQSSSSASRTPATPRWLYRRRRGAQVQLIVGGLALNRTDPRRFALLLLDTALGGGVSSRLFQELREKRGLVYSTYSFHSLFEHLGVWGVYAAATPAAMGQVVGVLQDILEDVAQHGITADELERARAQVKGSYVLGLENPSNRMGEAARAELFYRQRWDPDAWLREVDSVTVEEVQSLAAQLLTPSAWSVVALGPAAGEDPVLQGVAGVCSRPTAARLPSDPWAGTTAAAARIG